MTINKPKPTWEYPERSVLRFYREAGVTWFDLECGHSEARSDIRDPDRIQTMRCQDCKPVPRGLFTPPPGWE